MSTPNARPLGQVSEGISTVALLALLLISLTGSVAAVGWVDGLGMLVWPALGGMTLGILIAKFPVRSRVAHPAMVLYAFVASIAFPLFLLAEPSGYSAKLNFILTRLHDWTLKVIGGGTASDNLIFVIQLVFFSWLFGEIAAWFVFRRHQVWGAIILIGSTLLLNLFYASPQSGIYLALFLFSALLLVVRMNLHALERRWRQASIGYASDIIFDFFQYGVVFSLALLSLAWILPDTAPGAGSIALFDTFEDPWSTVEDQVSRLFSSVKPVERRSPGLFSGSALSIGGPIKLTDRPVLDIQAASGRYWRAAVYDRYTGSGWVSSHTDSLNLVAGDTRLGTSSDNARTLVTQTIQVRAHDPNNVLYAASQPQRFDLPVELRYSKDISDKSDFGFDLAFARSRRTLREGETYTVVSATSQADEDSLRAVDPNQVYPPWFASDYLQLPDRQPARLRNLALILTQGKETEYDKALAIEHYLRNAIKYSESVSAPPSGRDAVDYTLFDRPEGYCNYYASAMAVLARMVGIPARVASGYMQDVAQDETYHILEHDSHAWPELYFPGYGWLEFEPTSTKSEITRLGNRNPSFDREGNPVNPDQNLAKHEANTEFPDDAIGLNGGQIAFQFPFGSDPFNVALGALGLLAAGAVGGLVLTQWSRNKKMEQLAPAARTYEEMLTRGRWLGIRDQDCATPLERANALAAALPAARAAIEHIGTFYARERFGAWKPKMTDRAKLAADWSKVRGAWRTALAARIGSNLLALPSTLRARIGKINKAAPKKHNA